MQYHQMQHSNEGVTYIDCSLSQDAEAIDQLRRSQEQQIFTFNMITNVHTDYMGVYVESTIEVCDEQRA